MGWQVTATTIKCNLVDEFAVLMVYEDGTAKCNYFERSKVANHKDKRSVNCKGPDCPALAEFKERALAM